MLVFKEAFEEVTTGSDIKFFSDDSNLVLWIEAFEKEVDENHKLLKVIIIIFKKVFFQRKFLTPEKQNVM